MFMEDLLCAHQCDKGAWLEEPWRSLLWVSMTVTLSFFPRFLDNSNSSTPSVLDSLGFSPRPASLGQCEKILAVKMKSQTKKRGSNSGCQEDKWIARQKRCQLQTIRHPQADGSFPSVLLGVKVQSNYRRLMSYSDAGCGVCWSEVKSSSPWYWYCWSWATLWVVRF